MINFKYHLLHRNDRDNKGDHYNRERNYNRGDKIERPLHRDQQNRGPPPNRDDRDNRPPPPPRRRDDKDENIENRMPKFEEDVKPVRIHSSQGRRLNCENVKTNIFLLYFLEITNSQPVWSFR